MPSTATSRSAPVIGTRTSRRLQTRAAPRILEAPARAEPSHPLELETIAARWQRALDAAERAVNAASGWLPGPELTRRRRALVSERQETATMLARLAQTAGVQPPPWLSPVPLTTAMLGLPAGVEACLFDLEGVLTDSASLHAWAWGEVFDDLRMRLAERTGWQFVPFDRAADYRAYVDGRSRLEGVHAFLESRGVRLPEGRPDDPPSADTACGLAKRKGEALAWRLRQRGVSAVPGARRYLEAAARAGLERAVVSASASTLPMLELAGLGALVETRVDADVIRVEGLRSRPAPDLLLVVCRRLGVRPQAAVTFTHSATGVAAGRAAGLAVVGVADGPEREVLEGFGAERVVPALRILLDPRLA